MINELVFVKGVQLLSSHFDRFLLLARGDGTLERIFGPAFEYSRV